MDDKTSNTPLIVNTRFPPLVAIYHPQSATKLTKNTPKSFSSNTPKTRKKHTMKNIAINKFINNLNLLNTLLGLRILENKFPKLICNLLMLKALEVIKLILVLLSEEPLAPFRLVKTVNFLLSLLEYSL